MKSLEKCEHKGTIRFNADGTTDCMKCDAKDIRGIFSSDTHCSECGGSGVLPSSDIGIFDPCLKCNTSLPYWPYCEVCHKPYDFDKDEPIAHCACGSIEWGYPRPESYVQNPNDLKTRLNEAEEVILIGLSELEGNDFYATPAADKAFAYQKKYLKG